MSHSKTDAERAWDFGLVDGDCVAFPVCVASEEDYWSSGRLESESSYWRERNWVRWQQVGTINYFRVGSFRATRYATTSTKGVTEGSETTLEWEARFSTRLGTVDEINERRVSIRRNADGHVYSWQIPEGLEIRVARGDAAGQNQVIASSVAPMGAQELACPAVLPDGHVRRLLESKERTQRFTGVKLARLLNQRDLREVVLQLVNDAEEDVYIRLEGASYLASEEGGHAEELFHGYTASPDDQTRLEAVISLGEVGTEDADRELCRILEDRDAPLFLRGAAAWSLGRTGGEPAARHLMRAFADVDILIREEALNAIVSLGGPATPILVEGLREVNDEIAAGCAEALRRQQGALNEDTIRALVDQLRGQPTRWTVWLAGNLPREWFAGAMVAIQDAAPQLHYAVTLLWAFLESWIAKYWEPALPQQRENEEANNAH